MRQVLLALADHADQSGFAFPSVARLAEKLVICKRSVIYALNQLEQDGWLIRTKNGRSQVARLGIGEAIAPVESEKGAVTSPTNGAAIAPLESIGANGGIEQVQSTTQIGANGDTLYRKNHQEPSEEPPVGEVLFPMPAKKPKKNHVDQTAYVDLWNERCGALPKVRKLTKKRNSLLASRIAEGLTLAQFDEVLAKIQTSLFLNGDNDRGWKVSFGWVIESDDHITDILEGKYDRSSKPKPVRREMPSIGEDSHAAK